MARLLPHSPRQIHVSGEGRKEMLGHSVRHASQQRCVAELLPDGAIGFASKPATLGSDVSASLSILLESKASYVDAVLVQSALCERFHWLISSQILFRRKEIR
jgi:hypothetical protein